MSTGSVTAAGRLLPVAARDQPAAAELEAEIGYALFSRSGPRVTPPSKDSCCTRTWSGRWGMRQIRERAGEIARGQAQP